MRSTAAIQFRNRSASMHRAQALPGKKDPAKVGAFIQAVRGANKIT
jgi:hypothetical protein